MDDFVSIMERRSSYLVSVLVHDFLRNGPLGVNVADTTRDTGACHTYQKVLESKHQWKSIYFMELAGFVDRKRTRFLFHEEMITHTCAVNSAVSSRSRDRQWRL